MAKLKLVLGSTSGSKLNYLKEVIAEIGLDVEISVFKAESGIAEQPMTSDETKTGSINRALAALKAIAESDCGLGVEIGYHPLEEEKYEIFCWATIADREGNCVSQRSHGFMMPDFYQEKLRQGSGLRDHVMEYFKLDTDPVTQYVAEMMRGRKPFITQAMRDAFIFYLKKGEF